VGLIILRRALERAGFDVHYLATQNSLEQLCKAAAAADAMLVSNMDGHARYYLNDLVRARVQHHADGALWYLGGNPSLSFEGDTVQQLKALGFARVFLGYVDPDEVVALLRNDLAGRPRVRRPRPAEPATREKIWRLDVTDAALEVRAKVLAQWPTGADAEDFERNALALRAGTTLAAAQQRANQEGRVLVHPRVGVADARGQAAIFEALRDAGADVLSFQVDSLSRNNFHEAVASVLDSATTVAVPLNGFPVVNHGVKVLREFTDQFADVPLQVRHSTRDPRLLAEISLAAGITGYEGGALSYNLPYYRDYPLCESVAMWRYVDTLCGEYARSHRIVVDREFFGVLTATLVPPSLAIAVCVLEALLAAECGVRSVSLGYAEQGNRVQDVAAIFSMRLTARTYLNAFGYTDVAAYTVFHQYMGAFPADHEQARTLLQGSAVTAAMSGATRLMLKTHVEATAIPTATHNAESLVLVRDVMRGVGPGDCDARFQEETDHITEETCAILDAVLGMARGGTGADVVQAVERGLIDIPFSPSRWNAGRVVTVRDREGAVRFADTGSLPLPAAAVERNRRLVDERLAAENSPLDVLVQRDIQVGASLFRGWPVQA
jgi:methylaspartate mutase epsilon subunit